VNFKPKGNNSLFTETFLSDKFCFNSFSNKLVLTKINRIGKFTDELLTTSFCENNLLPEILMSRVLTFLRVFMLKKLVKNKNEIRKKKFLFLITFWFVTNHIELFSSVGPSILSLALHLKMVHPSLSHPLLISTYTYLEIHLLAVLLLTLVPLIQLIPIS